MLTQSAGETLSSPGPRYGANLYLWQAKRCIVGGINDVALVILEEYG